jgi:predicted nucleotide-binding protein (sugar kinase/HSP70/actin superfamily)
MVRAHVDVEARGARLVTFPFHLRERGLRRRELRAAAAALGVPLRRALSAAACGDEALRAFSREAGRLGRDALAALGPGRAAVVVVGRPYNTCDAGVCLDLPRTLRKLGALPIPIDCLPVREVDVSDAHPDMYWRSGQDILGAGRLVAGDERLQAIYLTSFHCGPDSFLLSYFRRLMGTKPVLELEVDDHTAEAGMLTRCEAFLDSLRLRKGVAA